MNRQQDILLEAVDTAIWRDTNKWESFIRHVGDQLEGVEKAKHLALFFDSLRTMRGAVYDLLRIAVNEQNINAQPLVYGTTLEEEYLHTRMVDFLIAKDVDEELHPKEDDIADYLRKVGKDGALRD